MQMCRADGSKLIADGDDAAEQLELKNLNPDKFKRYEQLTVVICVTHHSRQSLDNFWNTLYFSFCDMLIPAFITALVASVTKSCLIWKLEEQ
jgi:thiol-disulfide isomerase/thioredoxin